MALTSQRDYPTPTHLRIAAPSPSAPECVCTRVRGGPGPYDLPRRRSVCYQPSLQSIPVPVCPSPPRKEREGEVREALRKSAQKTFELFSFPGAASTPGFDTRRACMAGEGGVPPFGPESCVWIVPLLPKGGSGPTAEGVPRSQFSFRPQANFLAFFGP